MIGYVLKMFPRFSETFILAELLELERSGHRIEILALRKPDDGCFHAELARLRAIARYAPEHLTCHPARLLRPHRTCARRRPAAYLSAWRRTLWRPRQCLGAFLRAPWVAEQALAAGCSRLHAHFASLPAVTAMFAAELAGLPFTFTAHAKDIFHHRTDPGLLVELIRRARRVVTVSEYNREVLQRLPGVPGDRVARIYNGVDLEQFRPANEVASVDPPLILAIGRLVEKKGFADLIRACALLAVRGRRFRCEIVGKGALRADLQAQIQQLDLGRAVALVGPLPRDQVVTRLQRAALLAVPCLVGRDGNRDGLPTTLLEAAAAGVPAVATAVTGIPEAVDHGATGLVVTPQSPELLAAALGELLDDPARRRRMGAAARRLARQRFDLRRNVAQLAALLAEHPPAAVASGALALAPEASR